MRQPVLVLSGWILVNDDPDMPTAAEYRRRREQSLAQAHARYRTYLAKVLGAQGVDNAAVVAEVALEALTQWRDIDTGEGCRCSCHPQLPDTDLHDFGFDCRCTHTREQRRASFQQALNAIHDFWQSPEGLQSRAVAEAAERELQDWLAHQPGVVVHSHGGWAPEQWTGDVDGHSFYFRERGGDWDLEIGLHPAGRSIPAVDGSDDGATRYRQQIFEEGEVIATGTTDSDGYGATAVERAQFIVTTVRDHLARKACTHHLDQLDAISDILGSAARWCALCGARLPAS